MASLFGTVFVTKHPLGGGIAEYELRSIDQDDGFAYVKMPGSPLGGAPIAPSDWHHTKAEAVAHLRSFGEANAFSPLPGSSHD